MEKEVKSVKMVVFSACIGHDRRYTDTLEAYFLPETNEVRVTVSVTGAVGGMDGPGGTYAPRYERDTTVPAVPSAVLATIQAFIRSDSFSFHKYGKPSKNFRFNGVSQAGISLGKVVLALAAAKEQAEYQFGTQDEPSK